jgi:SPP1 gp7 family putative phage head morphogenesis protein
VIARPYGGANLDLNRKEYLMARVLQDALEQIARRINDQAGSAREALAGFDTARRDVTGPAFRTQIEHHVQQTVQMGTENAQRLLVAARERQWHRRHGAAGKKSTPFVPPLPSVSPQLMTPWSKLVKGITDHTVQHFDRIADDFKDRLTDTLKDGYQNGESAAQLGTRVKEALGVDRNRANERARTMTIETYNQAHIIQYQEAGASGVEWSAAEDERECDYCADLDGSVWALDDPDLIRPPAHSNCRCVLLPVLDDIPDDAPQPSQDTVDFCQDWRENYFDIPLYAPS